MKKIIEALFLPIIFVLMVVIVIVLCLTNMFLIPIYKSKLDLVAIDRTKKDEVK